MIKRKTAIKKFDIVKGNIKKTTRTVSAKDAKSITEKPILIVDQATPNNYIWNLSRSDSNRHDIEVVCDLCGEPVFRAAFINSGASSFITGFEISCFNGTHTIKAKDTPMWHVRFVKKKEDTNHSELRCPHCGLKQ